MGLACQSEPPAVVLNEPSCHHLRVLDPLRATRVWCEAVEKTRTPRGADSDARNDRGSLDSDGLDYRSARDRLQHATRG
jgi:hypothetical protein